MLWVLVFLARGCPRFLGTYFLILTVGLNVIGGSPAAVFSIAAALMCMPPSQCLARAHSYSDFFMSTGKYMSYGKKLEKLAKPNTNLKKPRKTTDI